MDSTHQANNNQHPLDRGDRDSIGLLTDAMREAFLSWEADEDDTDLVIRMRTAIWALGFRRHEPGKVTSAQVEAADAVYDRLTGSGSGPLEAMRGALEAARSVTE